MKETINYKTTFYLDFKGIEEYIKEILKEVNHTFIVKDNNYEIEIIETNIQKTRTAIGMLEPVLKLKKIK